MARRQAASDKEALVKAARRATRGRRRKPARP
jgi:hypothetical protein